MRTRNFLNVNVNDKVKSSWQTFRFLVGINDQNASGLLLIENMLMKFKTCCSLVSFLSSLKESNLG